LEQPFKIGAMAMGWANCGEDSAGRPIGYAFAATCDHPGCDKEIDRGLAYACGGMHGEGCLGGEDDIDWEASYPSCEKYFCYEHLRWLNFTADVSTPQYCFACADKWEAQDAAQT
jgi:hypothetical protein